MIAYATLTNEQKTFIDSEYSWLKGKSDPCHIAACISNKMQTRGNEYTKSNAFAAVLTYLVWVKHVSVNWKSEQEISND
jgi:hypothetical protein